MLSVFARAVFAALVLTIVSTPAYAQGEFVARGAYGFSVGGEMMPDGDRTSYTASLGFSIKGTLDLRLGYGWLEGASDSVGAALSGRGVQPAASLHIIKQGTTYPFSLTALGTYRRSTWDADMIGAVEATGSQFQVGGIIHSIFQITDFAGLRPWLGILYENRDREYVFADQPVINIEGDDTRYIGGAQVILMPTARSVFYVGPVLSIMAGEKNVGVTGGLVFN